MLASPPLTPSPLHRHKSYARAKFDLTELEKEGARLRMYTVLVAIFMLVIVSVSLKRVTQVHLSLTTGPTPLFHYISLFHYVSLFHYISLFHCATIDTILLARMHAHPSPTPPVVWP